MLAVPKLKLEILQSLLLGYKSVIQKPAFVMFNVFFEFLTPFTLGAVTFSFLICFR
jgi:hypothetical protein